MFEDKLPSDSRIALSVIIINLQVFVGKEDIKITNCKLTIKTYSQIFYREFNLEVSIGFYP